MKGTEQKIYFSLPSEWTLLLSCLGLKDRCLPKKAGTSLGTESMTPFPLNYYNFEMKGLSGKAVGEGITVLHRHVCV